MGQAVTRTIGFIQARMSSSRFPGKVLAELDGMPMLLFMLKRVHRCRMLDDVVVVTSDDPSDDRLAETLSAHGQLVYRGALTDVLGRFAAAAAAHPADNYVRLTGDCPLADPVIVDAVVTMLQMGDLDYASNVAPPSFPDGLDVEAFKASVLGRAAATARSPTEREHVTIWMRDPVQTLKRSNLASVVDGSHLRLTIDFPGDLDLVRRLLTMLPAETFDYYDILRALASNPSFAVPGHARNEALAGMDIYQ